MDNIQIVLIVSSALFLVFIFELTRKKRIRESYSLVWFLSGIIMLVFSVFRDLLEKLAAFFNVNYAPALIIPITLLIGLLLGIHFSIIISRLTEDNKRLIQEIGLLEQRLKELEDKISHNPVEE
ncbi:MAG: DUF2304 domain-containing protein [Acidobacteriota bacterium]|jgi:hypothetical protein|nr:DUF2304 domain-containing protein [Acidobacteriota bacterium]